MIVGYCNSEFYTDEYKGSAIPADSQEQALLHASLSIAMACNYRIGNLMDWPAFTQQQVKLATCTQAEYEYKYGDLEDHLGAIGSYSIGDVSVSANSGNTKSVLERHYKLSNKAISYLMPTGLLDRRLR